VYVDPGYEYASGLGYELAVNGKTTRHRVGKRDQFAAELEYFSECVRNDREPEPSGEDGMQDVRIVQALYESAETGKTVAIPPFESTTQPTRRQRIVKPPVKKPKLVKVKSAGKH
jgi:predicted dehydrogenase